MNHKIFLQERGKVFSKSADYNNRRFYISSIVQIFFKREVHFMATNNVGAVRAAPPPPPPPPPKANPSPAQQAAANANTAQEARAQAQAQKPPQAPPNAANEINVTA
jgi:hypothetical protein